jgi:hypothetical protein
MGMAKWTSSFRLKKSLTNTSHMSLAVQASLAVAVELESSSSQSGKARRWRRALRLELGPDPKLSELNLQSKLNQPSVTVGGSDLAEVVVCHSSARQSVVCVIE